MRDAPLKGLRILVVEDTLLVAELICEYLEASGCKVVGPVARLGAALQLARDEPLDGAILDINLRGEMSFSVAAALSARDLPYIFLTGYDAKTVVPPEHRAAPKLTKPFQLADLTRVAASCFHNARAS